MGGHSAESARTSRPCGGDLRHGQHRAQPLPPPDQAEPQSGSAGNTTSDEPSGAHARGDDQRRSHPASEPFGREPTDDIRRALDPARLRRGLLFADTLAVLCGHAVAIALWIGFGPDREGAEYAHLLLLAVMTPAWLISFSSTKLYLARAVDRCAEETRRICIGSASASIAVVVAAFLIEFPKLSNSLVWAVFVCVALFVTLERLVARAVFKRLRRSRLMSRRIAVIGTDSHAQKLARDLTDDPGFGYSVAGFIGPRTQLDRDDLWLGLTDDTQQALIRHGCSGVVISLASVSTDSVNRLTRSLTDQRFHVALSPHLPDVQMTRLLPHSVNGQTLLHLEPTIRRSRRSRRIAIRERPN